MLKKVYNHLRVKGKPLTVHTEMVVNDKVWEKVKEKALNYEVHTWYVITPTNFELFKELFTLKMDKEEFEQKLIERYTWLWENGQRIQLHIHLSKDLQSMTKEEQRTKIIKSIAWMEDHLHITVKEIVFGWWNYNQDTKEILDELGIDLIKRFEYRDCHDYDWIRDKKTGRIE